MYLIKSQSELALHLSKERNLGNHIGFVPTMGALHDGHMSLVKECKKACKITVVSIFVNPTQFDNARDFEAYPETLTQDLELLKAANVHYVFAPSVREMYGKNKVHLSMDFGGLGKVMEGESRAGHFKGVGLVVSKLFNLVKPDVAFFGEKDFQQLLIIKELNSALSFNIDIRSVPIARENDGLAMSSRNRRLNKVSRQRAALLFRSLKQAQKALVAGEEIKKVKEEVSGLFNEEEGLKLDYFEIADEKTLQPVKQINENKNYRLFIAAYVADVRLIDNLAL